MSLSFADYFEANGKRKGWLCLYAYLVYLYDVGVRKEDEDVLPFGDLVVKLSQAPSLMTATKQHMYQPKQAPFDAFDALHRYLREKLPVPEDATNANVSVLCVLNCPQKSGFLQEISYTVRYLACLRVLLGGVRFNIVDLRRYCIPSESTDDGDNTFCKKICQQVCAIVCAGQAGAAAPVAATSTPSLTCEAAFAMLIELKNARADADGFEELGIFTNAVAQSSLAEKRLEQFESIVIKRDFAQRQLRLHRYNLVLACGAAPKDMILPRNLELPPQKTRAGDSPDEQRFQRLSRMCDFGAVDMSHLDPSSTDDVHLGHACHPVASAGQQDVSLLSRLLLAHAQQLHSMLELSTPAPTLQRCRHLLQLLYFPLMMAHKHGPNEESAAAEVQRLWADADGFAKLVGSDAHTATNAAASDSQMRFVQRDDGGDETTVALAHAVLRRAIRFELWSAPSRIDLLRRALDVSDEERPFEGLDLTQLDFPLDIKNDQQADLWIRRARRGDVGARRILRTLLHSREVHDRAARQANGSPLHEEDIKKSLLVLFGADFLN
jgi:hypothetical protein